MHIDLTPADLKTITTLLNAYLPGTTVWAFGSRVKFTSKPASDLDLVAFIQPEQESDLADLKEAFAESDLPFKVDILAWEVIPDNFKKNIQSNYVILPDGNIKKTPGWKKFRLGELIDVNKTSINKDFKFDIINYIDTSSVTQNSFSEPQTLEISNAPSRAKRIVKDNDIIYSTVRPIQRHYGFIKGFEPNTIVSTGFAVLTPKEIDPEFLYYYLTRDEIVGYLNSVAEANTTTFPAFNASLFETLEINIPKSLGEQKSISTILSSLDKKIELNIQMNQTLEAIAQNIFKEWFVNFNFPGFDGELVDGLPKDWEIGILSDIAQVEIGRTPPRMEEHWFTKNPNDIKWISIRDLGQNGMYIFNTAEYLTKEAVERFRIPKIPTNSVVLSFKLTVGKLAITTEEMLSNEAIAQINSKTYSTEYVYSYLKNYNFDSLGSTSSIATATNSKVIKGMDFLIPQIQVVSKFTEIVNPIFKRLRNNSQEIESLIQIRDNLLPRLMTGKLKISA